MKKAVWKKVKVPKKKRVDPVWPTIDLVPVPSFDVLWSALTPREKQLARFAADQRGMTLQALLLTYPDYRHK